MKGQIILVCYVLSMFVLAITLDVAAVDDFRAGNYAWAIFKMMCGSALVGSAVFIGLVTQLTRNSRT